jgi:DNA-binding transcriptional ArsR family regulator
MEKSAVIAGLGALAQETRLDIVRYLVRKGADGAAAGNIGEHVRVPSATLAFHLHILTGAGLLIRRRSGRNIIYRVDYGRLHAITAYLLENCCAESGETVARPPTVSTGEPADLDSYRTQAKPAAKRRRP